MKARVLSPLFAGFLVSCSTVQHANLTQTRMPSDIVRDGSALDGKRVRVVGYLVLGQEVRALWNSPQDRDDAARRQASGGDPIWNHCLTAYYDTSIAPNVERASRSMVEVVGTVAVDRNDEDGVDLWGCNDTSITIHQIRRLRE
jgi:hypothetical protein